jgi:hypothetical protein
VNEITEKLTPFDTLMFVESLHLSVEQHVVYISSILLATRLRTEKIIKNREILKHIIEVVLI